MKAISRKKLSRRDFLKYSGVAAAIGSLSSAGIKIASAAGPAEELVAGFSGDPGKQEHLRKTQAFYEKHGGKTIVYAQFVPIIRTFAPFVAGIARMKYLRFASFNVFGAIGWVFSMTMLGYSLGSVPFVRRHFEKAIILIIFLSILPIIAEYAKSRLRKKTA